MRNKDQVTGERERGRKGLSRFEGFWFSKQWIKGLDGYSNCACTILVVRGAVVG